MTKFSCFSMLVGRKKKDKGGEKTSKPIGTLQVKLEHPTKTSDVDELSSTSFSVAVPGMNSTCKVKVMSHESPPATTTEAETEEVAYEGEDEHDETPSIKRDFSDFDLQARVNNYSDTDPFGSNEHLESKNEEEGVDVLQTGHVSDPGIGRAEFWASPTLQRSCSNLEQRYAMRKMEDQLPPSKSQSFEELQGLVENPRSPTSVTSRCSADRVMLKKHSSSQVLPSRSRKLWWKLFLWSHRNLHKPMTSKPQSLPISFAAFNQQGGYSSDTLEPNRSNELGAIESPISFHGEPKNKGIMINKNSNPMRGEFQGGVSGLWLQNQWVALYAEASPFNRVDEWVKDLEPQNRLLVEDDDNSDEGVVFPPSPDTSRLPERSPTQLNRRHNVKFAEEVIHANSVIQSLNSSSTVAHISGIGLKVIPTISRLSSLRSVNLSSNLIVHITPGSLPKGLHILNLSRNKISTIEGLRELTHLRVLDLSYNRIPRIGQGTFLLGCFSRIFASPSG